MGHPSIFGMLARDGTSERLVAEDVLNYDWKGHRHKYYGNRKVDTIFIVYIIAIFVWALIAYYINPGSGILITLIPFIVFLVAIVSVSKLSLSVEDEMFETNFLATGMLIILPLLSCIVTNYKGDRKQMVRIILLAITFTILSMMDVWVPEKQLSLMKHIRSIFQTISLTLILLALYLYYETMGDFPIMTNPSL